MKVLFINRKNEIVLLTVFLLILCTQITSYADITPVVDRTPEVRDTIIAAVPGVNAAADVTETHLAAISYLNLRGKGITALKSGDFSGLTGLTDLNLYGNKLSSLPDGIFEGLIALTTFRLGGNTVNPLPMTVSLEKVGDNQFKAVVPTGATFNIVLPITVTNGSVAGGVTTVTIPHGSVESETLTVTRTVDTTDAVTANIGTLPSLPHNHYGYILTITTDTLPIEIISAVTSGVPPVVEPTPIDPSSEEDDDEQEPPQPPVDPDPPVVIPPGPDGPGPESPLVFAHGTKRILAIAENTAAGMNIGPPFTAIDGQGNPVTYSLSGPDADSFVIYTTTGQLQTKEALDYETRQVYKVNVVASAGGDFNEVPVIITVIDRLDTVLETVTLDVSDRTPQVRDAIINVLPGVDVSTVNKHLVTITSLNLRDAGITSLKPGDFSGLSQLTSLNLYGNMLSSLPHGIFAGLTSLRSMRLGGNLADPMPLIVSLQQIDVNQYQAVLPTGAPFDVVLPINGTEITVAKGDITSDPFTSMDVPEIGPLPTLPPNHFGYVLAKSTVCNRTSQVTDAILYAIDSVRITDCRNVSEVYLAGITSLDLNGKGITSLQSDDLAGLFSLTMLDLRNNSISSLPAGFFEGLPPLTILDLSGNAVAPLSLAISLQKVGTDQLKAVMPIGAPFDVVLPISVANGTIAGGITTITISSGSVESQPITITRAPNTFAAVTANIGNLPSLPAMHNGYALVKSDSQPLEVLPILNSPPIFTEGATATRAIAENTEAGVNIGDPVSATDINAQDTLTYTLSGTDAAAFDIDSATGQLQTKAALDFETKTAYSAMLTVSDGRLTDTITVTINIIDIDENRAPVFTDGDSTTRIVAENVAAGTKIGTTIAATDADNDTLTYSLGGTDAVSFSIDKAIGQLKTSAALDYETKTVYRVTITVSDGKLTDTITVTISITDVVDEGTTETVVKDEPTNNAPLFTEGSTATRNVAEGTLTGVDIGTPVSATDADGHTITYKLGGTDVAAFRIDSTTGQLRTSAALDYETKSTYTVTITASDGSLTDTITVTINIIDATENQAPVFTDGSNTTRSVAENTGSGVDIGTNVAATDPNGDTLSYTLGGTDAASFSIDSTIGQLRTEAALDYETTSSYTVTITVSDGTLTDTITVTISITDVDELPANNVPKSTDRDAENNAPEFTEGTTAKRSVAENTGSGVNIGTPVSATDSDNDTPTYTLGGTDASSFGINSTNGQLRTDAALDYETKSSYSVTVSVSDGNGGSDSITVTINVTDVDENSAPVFTDGSTATRSIAENTGSGVNIGTAVSATDADNDTLTYTLGGTDASSFGINSTNGQLRTDTALDYETKASYSVTVSVSDGNGGSDSITVTINVADVNENRAPAFSENSLTRAITISTTTVAGDNIGDPITATDADNDTLTYTLGGTDADKFSIGSSSGQLQVTDVLLSDTGRTYSITVIASDGNDGSGSVSVTVNVIRATPQAVNSAPVFTDGDSTTRGVPENRASGQNFGRPVAATDADNDTLTYTLGGTDADSFSIVSTSGQLKTSAALDYETKNTYSVTVSVSDGNGGSDSITVTINITDVLDRNAPVFTEGDTATRTIAENTASGQNIGSPVSATDPENDTLTYYLGGTDGSSFRIDSSTGQLKTNAELDYETKSSYTVNIIVNDGLGGTDSIDVTINVTDLEENSPLNGRTKKVQNAIVALVPGVDNIADVTDTHLAAITSLDLEGEYGKRLGSLKSGDLDGLTGLRSLDLNSNLLSTLPSGVFDDLTELRYLYLNINDLSSFPSGVFDNLTKLVHLDLTYNALSSSSLPTGIFDNLTSMTRLDLNWNLFTDFPSGLFDELSGLKGLDLRSNKFTSLPSAAFDGLSSLTVLDVRRNYITSLPVDAFDGLTALTSLRLATNSLSTLPSDIFDELTNLEHLYLNDNNFTTLPSDIFDELTDLEALYLNSNEFTTYPSGLFDELDSLTHLYLYKNYNFTTLPSGIFDELTSLTYLDMEYNSLTDVSEIDSLTSLRKLYLEFNDITDISGIENLTSLITLDLARNDLTDISALENMTSLRYLFLYGNSISDYGPLRKLVAAVGRSLQLDITIPAAAPARSATPKVTSLLANYPNPSNPETWIPYQLSEPADVALTIYNSRGVVVRELKLGHKAAGIYQSRSRAIHWDGTNNIGEKVATGVYFYTLTAGDFTATRLMLILK